MLRLQGAMVALITPFTPSGAVDEEALRALVERQVQGGIEGLIPCGTTGESATMSAAERLDVIRITVEQVAGRVPVIAGTGDNNTAASVEFTRATMDLGADAALVVCPPYNKPNQDGLYAHFAAVTEVGLPVVLYNVPGRTVVSLTADTVGRLSRLPGVVAIKEATADLRLQAQMMKAAEDRITFLSGDDFTTFPFVAAGGDGCISVVGNLDPTLMRDLVAAAREGEREAGVALHQRVCALAELAFADSNPAPTKWMLEARGECSGTLRLPLVPIKEGLAERIGAHMKQAGYL